MNLRPVFLRRPRRLGAALLALLSSCALHAQFESRTTRGNILFKGALPTAVDPITTTAQFSGTNTSAGSSSPRSPDAHTDVTPAYDTSRPQSDRYPSAFNGVILLSSHFGGGFASGVPRYLLGDVITPPTVQLDNVTVAEAGYWRTEPIRAGESFTQPTGAQDAAVQVAANSTLAYYFSPHADRVFATQAGRVSITWVTRAPVTLTGDASPGLRYRYKTEIFSVSSAALKPTRTLYWTERGFNGPTLSVPAGKIETINPIYNSNFPQTVATEYVQVGVSNPSGQAELRTLWFEKTAGIGSLRAYNREGRIFIEYLGALKAGTVATHEFLGADIVEVIRVAPTVAAPVNLGKQILPRDSSGRTLPLDNSAEYIASPVLNTSQDGVSFYGSIARADGRRNYYAERENEDPDRVIFYWLQPADAAIHFYTPPEAPRLNLNWPVAKNAYLQRWPTAIADFQHYVVGASGSIAATGIQFAGGTLPQVVYQDDPSQTQAVVDANSQRLVVNFPGDGVNRALLKFTSGNEIWYVPILTQADGRSRTITVTNGGTGYTSAPTVSIAGAPNATVSVAYSGGAVTGIILTSPGTYFTPGAQIVLTGGGGTGATAVLVDPGFQEGDGAAAINATATVGQRIEAPTGYETAGYIVSGSGYLPRAYLDPFTAGMTAANLGAIIPVNAQPDNNQLEIRWFKRVNPESSTFSAFYVPAKIGRYTISYPASADKIVLASNAGSGDLAPSEIAGSLYVQNDRTKPGFNPNEEHALILGGRAYALRDDLNNTSATGSLYTSQPFVLIDYTSSVDQRPAMRVFKVLREDGAIVFNYPVVAGTILQPPMPLPLLPLPFDPVAKKVKNVEVETTPDLPASGASPEHYARFTFEDRKGYHWVYRGPHATGSPTLGMRFYYTMREGFYVPGVPTQPAVGVILPYLRPLGSDATVDSPSLTIVYRPVWPERAPELRVGETLTLAKFGLPDVLNQNSANVFYQQSVAAAGPAKASVSLHDPIREKTYPLGTAGGLAALPASALTTVSSGKTYFQGLPPHLQNRFFYDPLRGTKGALVLKGAFVDEVVGEDYVQLNVLPADSADRRALIALDTSSVAPDGTILATSWTAAIDGLATALETFVEDPARAGTYIVGATANINAATSASIAHPDIAVQDYALTGTGKGDGYVTLVFGNGKAFTPASDPVSVQVIKVAPALYTGQLKVKKSSNPLDEQVTLFHSGDFAARPHDYEFEWRYARTQDGVAPSIYDHTITAWDSGDWRFAQNPAGALPTAAEYAVAGFALPRSVTINPIAPVAGRPGLVTKPANVLTFADTVSPKIIFSADVTALTGFVLYVNGVAAVAHQAPAGFTASTALSGLILGGLPKQFNVDSNFFRVGDNTLEIALFSTADVGTPTSINFELHTSVPVDKVAPSNSPWLKPSDPAGLLQNTAIVGGSPTAPLGSPILVMSDNYFTLRYRPKTSVASVAPKMPSSTEYAWSPWLPPVLVEGWIKRVLAGINPFNQRMTDFNSNAVDTDVSILTQAGKRWEGNIALNLDAVASAGLIETYETLLNRGKNISIDSGYNDPGVNDALLLAAGYLNDLYTVLGNEAYADAANPTISIDDSSTSTEVNTSRFSFEGQVASVIEEELALLRGRDDFLTPGIGLAPAYNRLYWNYTRGINSGETLYAVNYDIREKAGSSTEDGIVDAADAQRMFPQGHGDAYGHYLTALTGYYRLLQNPNFTWTPRSEAVTVLGQAVQVDYFDERKFATAAANVGRTAAQVLSLTYRQSYNDSVAAGWTHFRDGKPNSATNNTRHWGLDEWASRAAQGSYYHWAVGNALLPDVDNNPQHTGVQIIDRRTVPALAELPALSAQFQSTVDAANARLNPLGLSPGAIAFDISPAELKSGRTHYEQISDRALRTLLNAKGAFDQAAIMTRSLRNQANQVEAENLAIVQEEEAYVNQLVEIYGTPYAGDIGVGKTYAAGYAGFDLYNWFIVDRPTTLVDTTVPMTVTTRVPVNVQELTTFSVADITGRYNTQTAEKTVTVQPNRFVQFSDIWTGGTAALGARKVTGKLQEALLDVHQAQMAFVAAADALRARQAEFLRRNALYSEMVTTKQLEALTRLATNAELHRLSSLQDTLNSSATRINSYTEFIAESAEAAQEFLPIALGLANDTTSSVRGGILLAASITKNILAVVASELEIQANKIDVSKEKLAMDADFIIASYGFRYEQAQFAYEYELLFRQLIQSHHEIAQLALTLQRTSTVVSNLLYEGDRIQADRTQFRQRAAAKVQGFRTKDFTFRSFRNEALEQYRSLFDLASRYTYLAAKSYDYETGLLGSTEGQSVLNSIVATRALGDLSGGVFQASVSTRGDSGLSGVVARLQADWSVAKGRLGLNNPDENGTLFSLRRELFRLLDDPATTDDDAQWQQTLESHVVSNLLADPDVAAHCLNLKKPDGSAVPGIVIPFRTTIEAGANFFGLPLAAGDHSFTTSSFSTKIYSAGVVLKGYLGMDTTASGSPLAGTPNSAGANSLSATPYVFLIPTGVDYMRAPPLGDSNTIRGWTVRDQALPLPFNLGNTAFSSTQFVNANGTLSEQPWILRKHQAFRPVADAQLFYSSIPSEFTSSRLVGRSAWNGGWKIVIPANTLLANEQDGLNRFVASVKDIELFLRTYSNSGN